MSATACVVLNIFDEATKAQHLGTYKVQVPQRAAKPRSWIVQDSPSWTAPHMPHEPKTYFLLLRVKPKKAKQDTTTMHELNHTKFEKKTKQKS